jgi:UDP-2,3-diacylglucosamine pyrophosphatase LpxH
MSAASYEIRDKRSPAHRTARRRILVISDLHMTAGRNPDTGVWSPTEDFFQDDEFARFLGYYGNDGAATTLVVNGDLFDFLQVLEFPKEWQDDRKKGVTRPKDYVYRGACPWHGRQFPYAIPLADINPTYGLRCTEEATRFLAGRVVEGHEQFFQALVDFATRNDNRVIFLKGNHDVQLFWENVQKELIDRMQCLVDESFTGKLSDRMLFKPWFHYVEGLAWIEHGNQYEYTTSFVNFLAPTLPFAYSETGADALRPDRVASGSAGANAAPPGESRHIELDFSSFLVRYLTNPGEPINPLADNIRPLTRYWEAMWKEHPFFVLGTLRAGVVFILKAFAKSAKMQTKTGWSDREMSDANRTLMHDVARDFNLPFDALKKLDECKAEPTMAHGPLAVIWWFFKPTVVGLLWLIPLLVVAANVAEWIEYPDQPQWYQRVLVIALRGAIVLVTGALLIGARQYYRKLRAVITREKARTSRKKAAKAATDAAQEMRAPKPPKLIRSPMHDLRTMAAYIAGTFDVPFVTFGHTHYADVHRIGDDRWYFNTGTWMTILEPREQLYREARQYTFLEITEWPEGEPTAELKCWYPPQCAPRPVVVVDMEELDDAVENGIVMSLLGKLGSIGGGG